MTRTITLTAAEAERVRQVRASGGGGGTVWLVREGECPRCGSWSPHPADPRGAAHKCNCSGGEMRPPVEFVAACQPCPTCWGSHGRRYMVGPNEWSAEPCPDCRIELVGLCPTCEGAAWDWKACADSGMDDIYDDPVDSWPCPTCFVAISEDRGLQFGDSTGTVTVAVGYAVGQPLPIVERPVMLAGRPPCVAISNDGTQAVWWQAPVGSDLTADLAHYGDPASLVGKWALQVEVVA